MGKKEIREEKDFRGRNRIFIYENYKKVGEVKKETDKKGDEVIRTYDNAGRETSVTRRESSLLKGERAVTRESSLIPGAGDIIRETRDEKTFFDRPKKVSYNAEGSKISETKVEKDWRGRPVEITRDGEGNEIMRRRVSEAPQQESAVYANKGTSSSERGGKGGLGALVTFGGILAAGALILTLATGSIDKFFGPKYNYTMGLMYVPTRKYWVLDQSCANYKQPWTHLGMHCSDFYEFIDPFVDSDGDGNADAREVQFVEKFNNLIERSPPGGVVPGYITEEFAKGNFKYFVAPHKD